MQNSRLVFLFLFFFSLSTLTISFHSLLARGVSEEKSSITLILVLYREGVCHHASFDFFQDFVFDFLQFEYDMPRYRFFRYLYLYSLLFSEFTGSAVLCLSLILENYQQLLLQLFLLFLSLFIFWYSHYLCTCYTFCNCLRSRIFYPLFFICFFFFPFALQFRKFLLTYLQVHRWFPWLCPAN